MERSTSLILTARPVAILSSYYIGELFLIHAIQRVSCCP
jgi:hypothetical protein